MMCFSAASKMRILNTERSSKKKGKVHAIVSLAYPDLALLKTRFQILCTYGTFLVDIGCELHGVTFFIGSKFITEDKHFLAQIWASDEPVLPTSVLDLPDVFTPH